MDKTYPQLAAESNHTVSELKEERRRIKEEHRELSRKHIKELQKKGYTNDAIARILDMGEWKLRALMVNDSK